MRKRAFKFLSRYILYYRWHLGAGLVFIFFTTAFQLASPWVLRYAIDFIQLGAQRSETFFLSILLSRLEEAGILSYARMLLLYVGLILFFTFIQSIFRFLMRDTMIGVSRKIEYHLRNDYFRHLQTLSPEFYQRYKTGDLMARATNDLDAVRSMLGPGIMHLVSTVFVAIATIALMTKISLSLTIWTLLPLPVVAIVVNRLVAKIHKLFALIQAQFAAVTAKVQENISGIRVVKSYVQEKHEIESFKLQNKDLIQRNLDMAKVRAMLNSSIEFLLGLSILIVIWVGGKQVISGQLTIGGLVAFIAYVGMLAWPMIAFGWVLNLWQQGLASLNRLLIILDEKPVIADSAKTDHSVQTINGHITFQNVTFSYNDKSDPVLDDITLDIPQGATLAIVGPTGCGKSTLVNLIPRLYDVTEGKILIDGRDIRDIPLQVLRKNIGYVPQETFLFSDSLQENISFGLEELSEPDIEDAAEVSQLKSDFDQFPDGLNTVVGERGLTLSGGQKQRTAISRAVIRKPKILILDDSLSSVDTYTEEEILKRLKKIMQDRTSIIVSHRVSTVRDADIIIVLKDGKIAEQGSHKTLLRKRGLYYAMYQRQLLEKSLQEL